MTDLASLLVEEHRRFLAFLERRLGSRDAAEDVLQSAFVRGLERAGTLRSEESLRAWFYRLLRNAAADHHRRRATTARTDAELPAGFEPEEPPADAAATACACILGLAQTLEPEYAAALRRVEVEGASVQDFAREAGITPNNASVRLFRAREALRRRVNQACRTCATHGCLDCSCAASEGPAEPRP